VTGPANARIDSKQGKVGSARLPVTRTVFMPFELTGGRVRRYRLNDILNGWSIVSQLLLVGTFRKKRERNLYEENRFSIAGAGAGDKRRC
jgi:hypothetical protein